MITIEDLEQLAQHYKCSNAVAIEKAEQELPNVLDKNREYTPFITYICLVHMNGNPKYTKTFSRMSDEEKTEVFNETIEELRKLNT